MCVSVTGHLLVCARRAAAACSGYFPLCLYWGGELANLRNRMTSSCSLHRLQTWTVWPSRWVCVGRQGTGVLPEEDQGQKRQMNKNYSAERANKTKSLLR